MLSNDGCVCEFFNKKECYKYLDNDQFFGGLRFPKDAGFDPIRFIHGITKSINKKNGDGNLDLTSGVFTPKSTEDTADKTL